jgi:hypothetical protein
MTRPVFLLLTVVSCVLDTCTTAACCWLDLPLPLKMPLATTALALLALRMDSGRILLLKAIGLARAWIYCAPPLRPITRGVDEAAVAMVWFLVVVSTDFSGYWRLAGTLPATATTPQTGVGAVGAEGAVARPGNIGGILKLARGL